ncbi:hypothetical protein Pmani_029823 [Petrolisthes manimaculis]|uniref:Uncharacterized protein n=1 Tax=Petrolisthes manimaculis TaxID=1843537 RepID=A0AAE1NYS9_9EUCA|nr:hypothetical protein Pmani_029823 [Petrolisthes manimaculis]
MEAGKVYRDGGRGRTPDNPRCKKGGVLGSVPDEIQDGAPAVGMRGEKKDEAGGETRREWSSQKASICCLLASPAELAQSLTYSTCNFSSTSQQVNINFEKQTRNIPTALYNQADPLTIPATQPSSPSSQQHPILTQPSSPPSQQHPILTQPTPSCTLGNISAQHLVMNHEAPETWCRGRGNTGAVFAFRGRREPCHVYRRESRVVYT